MKIIWVILAAGLLFRLCNLGKKQLWTDELIQGWVVRASSIPEMMERLQTGMAVPAPLDYLAQKGIVSILGESNWTLRLHAVIFGTLSIWFFFRVARLLFGDRVAVYSTILFTLYPLHYHYSQEGRPYALLVFLTLVSYDLLLRRIVNQRAPFRGWILLGCLLVLLLYSSFLGVLVLCSQWLALVVSAAWKPEFPSVGAKEGERSEADFPAARWSHVRSYTVAALVACAFFVPWVRYAWAKPSVTGAAAIADPMLILRMIKELGDNSYPMAGLLLLGTVTGIRALHYHGRRQCLVWLLSWAVVSIPAVIILELWSGYFFAIRHILHATPPVVLLAGYGLSYTGERLTILDRLPPKVSAPAILYIVVLLPVSLWIAQSHWKAEPVDWRGTARFLHENIRAGDALTMPQVHVLLEYYYPSLAAFSVTDLDPGPGSLASAEWNRRYVVCFNQLKPDPCSGFRMTATKDPAWLKRELRGFTIFIRGKHQ
jgi:hypothetical protein